MCIAILNRKGTLSSKIFKNCWTSNPDGAGLTYYDGSKAVIIKEMKSYKVLHKKYLEIRSEFPLIDIAIHFRISTHGKINETNCHPFRINKHSAFIHNGMINNLERNSEVSDTYIFNEVIMKQLPSNFGKNGAITELISNFIGYSKLVIIDRENSFIINEHLGHWNQENWFSNKSYEDKKIIAPKVHVTQIKKDKTEGYNYAWNDFEDTRYYPTRWGKYDEKTTCEGCLNESDVNFSTDYNMYLCPTCEKYCDEL